MYLTYYLFKGAILLSLVDIILALPSDTFSLHASFVTKLRISYPLSIFNCTGLKDVAFIA